MQNIVQIETHKERDFYLCAWGYLSRNGHFRIISPNSVLLNATLWGGVRLS
jgi:hypothetical protein